MNETHMKQAVALSRKGMELGHGGPFGAVIVRDGAIVGEGWNEVLSSNDPTAHAEVVAIRNACRERGTYDLSGCEIYSSCEPCPMCLSAIYWSRIGKVYFSIGRHDAAMHRVPRRVHLRGTGEAVREAGVADGNTSRATGRWTSSPTGRT